MSKQEEEEILIADEQEDIVVSDQVVEALNQIGYVSYTPIQQKGIPAVLAGRDLIASAETGSGKTGSFMIPIVEKILKEDARALVLAPTRELATQIAKFGILNKIRKVRYNLVIGGTSYYGQEKRFKDSNLVIATPGRLNDHIEKGNFKPGDYNIIVLDETDMMLDMNFEVQIRQILRHMPNDRQILMFSATFPKKILSLVDTYLKDPVKIILNEEGNLPESLVHRMVEVDHRDKEQTLIDEVGNRDGSILVFANTKVQAENLSRLLYQSGQKAKFMHGGLKQSQRDVIVKNFIKGGFRILVATDVLARGISIGHIKHVISYDLPQNKEDYTHRVGRTARANKHGEAIAFVGKDELSKSKDISEMLNLEPLENAKNLKSEDDGRGRGRRRNSRGGGFKNRNSRSFSRDRDHDSRGSRSSRDSNYRDDRDGGYKDSRRDDGDYNRGSRDGNSDHKRSSFRDRKDGDGDYKRSSFRDRKDGDGDHRRSGFRDRKDGDSDHRRGGFGDRKDGDRSYREGRGSYSKNSSRDRKSFTSNKRSDFNS